MKTIDYLDLLVAKYGSDYKVAKALNVKNSTVSRWRCQKGEADQAFALRIADLLEIDRMEVLANIQAASAKNADVRQVWVDLAKKLHHAAAVLILSGGILLSAGVQTPITTLAYAHCVLCQITKKFRTLVQAFRPPAAIGAF